MPMSNENWLQPEVVEQATAAPGEQRDLAVKHEPICAACGQSWPCEFADG